MHWCDLLRCGWQQLRRSGMSAVLAILAVAIGVASVVAIYSSGVSACSAVKEELGQLGGNLIFMYARENSTGIDPALSKILEADVEGVQKAVALNLSMGSFSISTQNGKAALVASTEGLDEILPLELLYGGLPTAADIRESSRVAVIDEHLAIAAFGRSNVVGKTIQLRTNGHTGNFTIVGVMAPLTEGLDSILGYKIPALIMIPYTAFGNGNRDMVRYLMVSGDGSAEISTEIINEIEKYNLSGAVGIENIGAYISQAQNVLGVVSVFILLIGCIALLIAGCSVMSSMLSLVKSRRHEIGVYMALGASSRTITALYLTESVILCLLGNLTGLSGYAAVSLICALMGNPLPISAGVLVGISAAMFVEGLLCGILPARRAARLEPMQILME